jgi:hypothetical protein
MYGVNLRTADINARIAQLKKVSNTGVHQLIYLNADSIALHPIPILGQLT